MRRPTLEEVGVALVAAVREHAQEIDPENRPGFTAVHKMRTLLSYLPPEHRPYVYQAERWLDQHPQYGVLAKERHGRRGSLIFMVDENGEDGGNPLPEYALTARSWTKDLYHREQRAGWKVEGLSEQATHHPEVLPDILRAVRAQAEAQAANRSLVISLGRAMGVDHETVMAWLD